MFCEYLQTNTVRVTNVSAKATAHDIHDFFSFSGEIENIDLHRYVVRDGSGCRGWGSGDPVVVSMHF